jgi:hypothetical protein
MRGVHHCLAEGRRRVLDERDVTAKLRREATAAFDAGVRKNLDHDRLGDTLLLEPEIEIGARELARPLFFDDDVAGLW